MGTEYTCYVQNLTDIETKEGLQVPIGNTPVDKIANVQIKTEPNEPGLDHFPTEIFSQFPNLQYVTISSQIKEFTASDCIKGKNLKHLFLDSNNLRKLSAGVFQHAYVMLSFKKNKIDTIDDFTFANQNALTDLYLQENKLTKINKNTFAGMPVLNVLNLSVNEIHTIEDGAFAHLTALLSLELSQNKIATLNYQIFDGITSLKYVNLKSNIFSDKSSVQKGLIQAYNKDDLNLEI